MRRSGTYWIIIAFGIAALLVLPVAVFFATPTVPTAPLTAPTPRLHLSVSSANDAVEAGTTVSLAVHLDNVGNATAYLVFPSSCEAAFRVSDVHGSVVYDASAHAMCEPTVTNLVLPPGASERYAFTWDQTTDEGLPVPSAAWYTIEGLLLTTTAVPVSSVHASVYVRGSGAEIDLALAAHLDRAVYTSGDVANVTLTLTNIGVGTVTLQFGTPCFVQFIASDPAYRDVYNSSKHTACILVMTTVILEPGASRSTVMMWGLTDDAGAPLPAGLEYRVVPSFVWSDSQYEQYVSRVEVATFTIGASVAAQGGT